jgi:hypothetical protein
MNIRALLVKTFARETSEVRGGFVAVPAGMSLKQGLALLNQDRAGVEGLSRGQQLPNGGNGLLVSTEATLHR